MNPSTPATPSPETPALPPVDPLTGAQHAVQRYIPSEVWKAFSDEQKNAAALPIQHAITAARGQDAQRIAELEKERDARVDAFSNAFANINDTCRSRGFDAGPCGHSTQDRVIALAQAYDQLRQTIADLQFRVTVAEKRAEDRQGQLEQVRKERDSLLEPICDINAHPIPELHGWSREHLGRVVRDVWVAWAKNQPSPKESWLKPWSELNEPDKEVDRQIGETLAGLVIRVVKLRWKDNQEAVEVLRTALAEAREQAQTARREAAEDTAQGFVFAAVKNEVMRATAKFPTWPTDPLHAFAVVSEEFGEAQKEVLQLVYEPHKSSQDAVRKEAVQLAAMSIRFLMSLDIYEYTPREQHSQDAARHAAGTTEPQDRPDGGEPTT